MKSSLAVFSNQGNPFPHPVKSKTHYRPSQPQVLSEEQKQTVLSPVRLPHHLSDALSPPDLNFLGGSQRLVPGLPESDSSGPFDESWPSTEGSSKSPEQDSMQTGSAPKMTGIQGGSDSDPSNGDSVIARYMERFRSGQPTSRMERSPPQPAMKEFWWLQTSPDSPDAQRFRPGSGISSALRFSPQTLDLTPLAEGSLNDSKLCPEDVDILGLQERARKLILQSESSLSSGGHVSSEGVGSSPSSVSDVSGNGLHSSNGLHTSSGLHSSNRLHSSTLDRAPVVSVPQFPFTLPFPPVRTHTTVPPEEDILYQWRLRRKMEQAREGTLPISTRKRSPSPPIRIPKQVLPAVEPSETFFRVPPPEAAESSHPAAPVYTSTSCFGHVPLASPHIASHSIACSIPPHLHLQCDLLPCVHSQQPAPCTQRPPGTEVVRPPGTEVVRPPGTEVVRPPDNPPASVPPQTGQFIQSEEKKTAQRRPQRRPNRPEEKNVKSKGDKSKRTSDKPGPSRVLQDPPPSSPVHQVMGQVISERLFSPLQSPKMKPKKRGTAPPREKTEELQPIEIAAHLLEAAEDSDGTEFSDDPLLQVLREQRQSLRSRLREVDLRLAEMEGKNIDTQSHPR